MTLLLSSALYKWAIKMAGFHFSPWTGILMISRGTYKPFSFFSGIISTKNTMKNDVLAVILTIKTSLIAIIKIIVIIIVIVVMRREKDLIPAWKMSTVVIFKRK